MKTNIHPVWYKDARVTCACGNSFTVGLTKPELKLEICNKCHPFFTGEMKFVDTMGRVERFQAKQKIGAAQSAVLAAKKKKKEKQEQELHQAKSLKEMLMGIK